MMLAGLTPSRTLALITLVQVVIFLVLFWQDLAAVPRYLGFTTLHEVPLIAWGAALAVTVLYVGSASSISSVRAHLVKLDGLKLLAVVAAIFAGIVEEVIFRKLLMDALANRDVGEVLQVVASALAFGAVHLVWGVRRLSAGVNAFISTALLGGALAVIYLLSGRNLAACVLAHIVITGLIEPGLLIAAAEDRLGFWRERKPKGR